MTSPRTVIRGESIPSVLKDYLPVSIDYLSFTIPNGNPSEICKEVKSLLGVWERSEVRSGGMHGYVHAEHVGGFGIIAYGGDSQKGTVFVSINGQGCARIASFRFLADWAVGLGARITRLDIAADDLKSRCFSVRRGLNAWRSDRFNCGGRMPNARLINDLGSQNGKTLYIGSRAGGKLCRIYEKGRALGDKLSRWVRAEVELHAKDRVIPWDAVTNPVPFLAGTYPFFEKFSFFAERISTFKAGAELSIEKITQWARLAVGKTLNVLVRASGGDLESVVLSLRRDGVPARLKAWFDKSGEALPCPA